eukprot:1718622-Prymnesium_polylepis.1
MQERLVEEFALRRRLEHVACERLGERVGHDAVLLAVQHARGAHAAEPHAVRLGLLAVARRLPRVCLGRGRE